MLTEYVRAAMRRAKYKKLDEGGGFLGRIPGFRGVLANADTLKACREGLRSVLEDWIIVGVRLGHSLPIVDGITLNPRKTRKRKVA